MGSAFSLLAVLSTLLAIVFFDRRSRSSEHRLNSENGMLLATPVPFRFIDLPVELRLYIYTQVLVTEEPLRWIGPKYHTESRNGSLLARTVKVRDKLGATVTRNGLRATTATAILFTCKTICLEAIDLFYQNNVFEVSPTDFTTQPILRRQPLPYLVRRLRVQYRGVYDPSRVLPTDYTRRADVVISSCLQDVIDRCPNLTSLTIGGIPDPNEVDYASMVEDALGREY